MQYCSFNLRLEVIDMLDPDFIKERITQLRLEKGVSEYLLRPLPAAHDGISADLRLLRHNARTVF